MIRSYNTKAESFSCAGEKFSTLAEALAFVESPESPNSEKATVGFRFRKRICLDKDIRLDLGKRAPRSAFGGHGLATSINARRESQDRCACD
jgi:hypothetical protein